MKKLLIFTVIVSAVTLGGLWSGRKFCAMMSIPAGTRTGQALYSEMGLDASQAESVKKLETSFRKEADELCMKVCRERVSLLDQIKNGRIDREDVDQKVEAIGQLQISLEKKTAAHILDINKILTPSQSGAYLERIYQQQCRMIAQNGYERALDKK